VSNVQWKYDDDYSSDGDDEGDEYYEEIDGGESREYHQECEIPPRHWFDLLARLAAKAKGVVRIEWCSLNTSRKSDT
jgi:hypothetical protein